MTIEEVLSQLPELTNTLTPEETEIFSDNMTVRTYKKNEIIYHEDEVPTQLFCLLKGKVKIYKDGVGGRSQIVRVMHPVEMFGYRAAFSGSSFITAAAAFEPCTIACVPLSIIKVLIGRNAQFAWVFIRQLATILGISDERTVSLTQKHIRGRLAESILFMKKTYGVEDDGATLNISLTREDMANLSNMTTSNAIRHLNNFAQEGLIKLNGRKISLINEDELRHISQKG
ncbi:MAG: Crp/Fnr family transcriptional regulator [Bacteroidaceae bacterium]|nr:Crp/Fnr family transcriptional regulator [Bacteroidaceae bacterium]